MALSRRAARGFLITATAVVSGVLIAGCGSSSNSSGSAGKAVSLVHAADLSTSEAGYKMSMTEHAAAGGTQIDATGSGVWDAKDHEASILMNMTIAGQTLPIQMVFANDTIYEQLPSQYANQMPGGKPWLSFNLNELAKYAKLPSMSSLTNSGSSGNPSQYLEYLKAAGKSVQDLGQETVAGVQTTHYRAALNLSELPDTVPASDRQAARHLATALKNRFKASYSPIDVWVDQADLVRKIQMSLSETVNGHAISVTLIEEIDSYGAEPPPTIPSSSQTSDLVSLLKSEG
jgi:hypothetical protein